MDQEYAEHVTFVFNQLLQFIRKGGITPDKFDALGLLLRRFIEVTTAYSQQRKLYTLQEWIGKLQGVVKETGLSFLQAAA